MVNLVEGLVEEREDGLSFLGSRCISCGETIFPQLRDCPQCRAPDAMEPYAIPGRGVVLRAIVAERGAAGFPVPYVQGYVKLDAGPVIYSTLDVPASEADSVIGAVVYGVVGPVSTIGDRVNSGWKFRSSRSAT